MTPAPLPDREVERALVVTAHPDDVDFGAAATVAAWTGAGIDVTYCVITDGQAGGFDPRSTAPTSPTSGTGSSAPPRRRSACRTSGSSGTSTGSWR